MRIHKLKSVRRIIAVQDFPGYYALLRNGKKIKISHAKLVKIKRFWDIAFGRA